MPKSGMLPNDAIKGFMVTISGPDGTSEADGDWETCTGGAIVLVAHEVAGLPDRAAATTSPGHKYVDTLTLRGPLTAGRKALCQWIMGAAKGVDDRRTVTVREILKDGSAGKTYNYHDCFPTKYVFPSFSADSGEPLYEEVQVKPIRLELS